MTATTAPRFNGSYPTLNDRLVSTVTGGASDIQIRSGDGRVYRLVRASDGMELACLGSSSAATTRANELVASGAV